MPQTDNYYKSGGVCQKAVFSYSSTNGSGVLFLFCSSLQYGTNIGGKMPSKLPQDPFLSEEISP